jgi:hypothetical protein
MKYYNLESYCISASYNEGYFNVLINTMNKRTNIKNYDEKIYSFYRHFLKIRV